MKACDEDNKKISNIDDHLGWHASEECSGGGGGVGPP